MDSVACTGVLIIRLCWAVIPENTGLLANFRLIFTFRHDPTVHLKTGSGLEAKKSLFLAVKLLRLVFFGIVLALPFFAYASILSMISDLFGIMNVEAESISTINSQTIALLQAPVHPDPLSYAKGGGDISIVGGVALLSDSGPNGGPADIESSNNKSGNISVYVVREGDTLSQIAKMFGVTTNTIAWNNDIQRGVIRPGQTLIILPISGVSHTVKSGDTIASIAKQYKADAEEIRQYNQLTDGATLAVGSVIVVPDGVMAPVAVSPVTSNLRGAGGTEYVGYYMRPIIGWRKTQGLHGYNGVDLANYYGAPVLASAMGEVIIARSGGYNGGYGSYVVISHSNGTQTLYGHLSAVLVAVGQYVAQGQVIGNTGSTGKSTGPHLHFEIRGARNPF